MSFCTNCGAKLGDGQLFCGGCGAKANSDAGTAAAQNESTVNHFETASTPEHAFQTPHSAPPANTPHSNLAKILIWTVVVLVVLGGLGVAGAMYAGREVVKKVSTEIHKENPAAQNPGNPSSTDPNTPANANPDATQRANPDGKPDSKNNDHADPNVAKALDTVDKLMNGMGFGDPPPNPYADLPVVELKDINNNLCEGADNAKDVPPPKGAEVGPSGIPMRTGLVVVHAWGRKSGDSESINSVSKITDKYVAIADSGTYFANADDTKGNPGSGSRDVCANDIQTAHGLRTGFGDDGPLTSPGSTTIDVSRELFSEFRTNGKADFRYLEWIKVRDLPKGEGYVHWSGGVLTRVEPNDVSMPVIVNGTPTTLPAIHASGTVVVEDKKARELSKDLIDKPLATEIYVLDDSKNPLVLLYKMDINNFRVQVTEIRFPVEKPETKIEQDLLKNKKAVVYGIYFDYNSDQIKKESEPVLKEIAQALKNNPGWKLTVDGHTDGIGGDAFNLDLSQRRSASVKKALVTRFGIDPGRLVTGGYGKSRPVDRNDTLEGRAKNRRVELTRE